MKACDRLFYSENGRSRRGERNLDAELNVLHLERGLENNGMERYKMEKKKSNLGVITEERSDFRGYLLILNNLQKSFGVDVTGDSEKWKSFEEKARKPGESDPDEQCLFQYCHSLLLDFNHAVPVFDMISCIMRDLMNQKYFMTNFMKIFYRIRIYLSH